MKRISITIAFALMAFIAFSQTPVAANSAAPLPQPPDTVSVLLLVSDTSHSIDSTIVKDANGAYSFRYYEIFKSNTLAYMPGFAVIDNGVVTAYLTIYRKRLTPNILVWNAIRRN